jgi:hypothetical protein
MRQYLYCKSIQYNKLIAVKIFTSRWVGDRRVFLFNLVHGGHSLKEDLLVDRNTIFETC